MLLRRKWQRKRKSEKREKDRMKNMKERSEGGKGRKRKRKIKMKRALTRYCWTIFQSVPSGTPVLRFWSPALHEIGTCQWPTVASSHLHLPLQQTINTDKHVLRHEEFGSRSTHSLIIRLPSFWLPFFEELQNSKAFGSGLHLRDCAMHNWMVE